MAVKSSRHHSHRTLMNRDDSPWRRQSWHKLHPPLHPPLLVYSNIPSNCETKHGNNNKTTVKWNKTVLMKMMLVSSVRFVLLVGFVVEPAWHRHWDKPFIMRFTNMSLPQSRENLKRSCLNRYKRGKMPLWYERDCCVCDKCRSLLDSQSLTIHTRPL